MTYGEKKKLCKEINSDRIYEEISHGIVCCCYRKVNGSERLEVLCPESPLRIHSKACNEWPEDTIIEWIIYATIQLRDWISADEDLSDTLKYNEVPFE